MSPDPKEGDVPPMIAQKIRELLESLSEWTKVLEKLKRGGDGSQGMRTNYWWMAVGVR
jgi:hypothetical protein